MADPADFSLRPMVESDRVRILAWRNTERVRSKMYTDHVIEQNEHDRWFDSALSAGNARYLVFEHSGRPIGFVAFTQIDDRNGRCLWGFYLGEEDVPWGSAVALEFCSIAHAFEDLAIRKLCCEVLASNAAVIKLHQRFGFRVEARYVAHVRKGERFEDVVGLALFAHEWNEQRDRLHATFFRQRGAPEGRGVGGSSST